MTGSLFSLVECNRSKTVSCVFCDLKNVKITEKRF
jgi:hypothetical protein